MPRDLTEEAVADWMDDRDDHGDRSVRSYIPLARAVLALVEAKVREGVELTDTDGVMSYNEYESAEWYRVRREKGIDAIVARVMNKEATNG
jgi:hypothetical protein